MPGFGVVRYFDNLFVKDGIAQRVNGADSINFWLHSTNSHDLAPLTNVHVRYADSPSELGAQFESVWWDLQAGDITPRTGGCRHPAGAFSTERSRWSPAPAAVSAANTH